MIGHYGHCRDEEHDEYAEAEDPFVNDRAWRGNVEIEGREGGVRINKGSRCPKPRGCGAVDVRG